MLNIAVLASTRATDMQAIIDSIERGELDARIACLIANKDCYALERARKYNIDAVLIDQAGKTREEFDLLVLGELEKRDVGLILLIGYMRILSNVLIEKYRNRIMNVHPSLLPAFSGGMDRDVHQAVLDRGCKITGCTLHFVTEEVDGGPIIMQKAVSVEERDSPESLKQKVQKAEQSVLVEAVKLFAEGRLKVEGNNVWVKLL